MLNTIRADHYHLMMSCLPTITSMIHYRVASYNEYSKKGVICSFLLFIDFLYINNKFKIS